MDGKMTICVVTGLLLVAAATASDQVEVAISDGVYGCSTTSVGIVFNDMSLPSGDGSLKVYSRTNANFFSMAWAEAESQTLEASDFLGCARAAAAQDLEAFSFTEECKGYELSRPLCGCGEGDLVVYVRADYRDSIDSLVPLQDGVEGPSVLFPLDARNFSLEMILPLSVPLFDPDCSGDFCSEELTMPVDSISEVEDTWAPILSDENRYILSDEELGAVSVFCTRFDFESRRTASSCGVPAVRSYTLKNVISKYFLEECGQTILLDGESSLLLYSHRGMGSVHFPSNDDSISCNVSIVCPTCSIPAVLSTEDFVKDSSCGGYAFELYQFDEPTVDLCSKSDDDNLEVINLPDDEAEGYIASVSLAGSSSSSREVSGFVFLVLRNSFLRRAVFESDDIPFSVSDLMKLI